MLSANPNAPIRGCEHGLRRIAGQTFFLRNSREREFSKPVESSTGGGPDVAFTVLEKPEDDIARESIRSRKYICPAVMYMDDPAIDCSDPEASIAVPEQFIRVDRAGYRILLEVPAGELCESYFVHGDQQPSVIGRFQIVDLRWRCHISLWRTGFPSPKPRLGAGPESAGVVLIQGKHASAEDAIPPVALGAAAAHGAELAGGTCQCAGPHRSLIVLEQRRDKLSIKIPVGGQPGATPGYKASKRSNPKRAVARGE